MKDVRVVLVTGSRDWIDRSAVFAALAQAFGDSKVGIVRHGDCPTGADKFADEWAQLQPGIAVERRPADWEAFGKSAGPRRNRQMVMLGADLCLAFPQPNSRGTINCMGLAKAAGIPVQNEGAGVSY